MEPATRFRCYRGLQTETVTRSGCYQGLQTETLTHSRCYLAQLPLPASCFRCNHWRRKLQLQGARRAIADPEAQALGSFGSWLGESQLLWNSWLGVRTLKAATLGLREKCHIRWPKCRRDRRATPVEEPIQRLSRRRARGARRASCSARRRRPPATNSPGPRVRRPC